MPLVPGRASGNASLEDSIRKIGNAKSTRQVLSAIPQFEAKTGQFMFGGNGDMLYLGFGDDNASVRGGVSNLAFDDVQTFATAKFSKGNINSQFDMLNSRNTQLYRAAVAASLKNATVSAADLYDAASNINTLNLAFGIRPDNNHRIMAIGE